MRAVDRHAAAVDPREAAALAPVRVSDDAWLPDARALVADLMVRRPALYWIDLALSAGAAWGLAALYFRVPAFSAPQLLALPAAGVMFFRAGTFMHEIAHFGSGQMRGFVRFWNLVIGMPLLMPSVTYNNHLEHHSTRHFGTPADGEYLPLAASPLRELLKYLLQAPLLPLLAALRFGLLAPLSWAWPRLREWLLAAASSGVINPHYCRRYRAGERSELLRMELACFAYLALIAVLLLRGSIASADLLKAYVLMAWALSLNWVRTLAAHRHDNDGRVLSRSRQFADSIHLAGRPWLAALMFPVGLRYHALHHLFPSLPYHNLGAAHRRLLRSLPADPPYHAVSRDSFFAVVAQVWRGARQTAPGASAMRRWTGKTGLT